MNQQPSSAPDPAPVTKIPVRSRRQAMDWSLVLVSQGIESTIERDDDGAGWRLLVSAQDGQNALKALRQYRVEIRGWPWPQSLPWPATRFDWGSTVFAGLLIFFYWWSTTHPLVREAGVLDADAVYSGQWWRIFTAIMLHADVAHLAGNLSIGVVLFGLAMGRYGTGVGLLAAYLTGVAGNLFSLLVHGHAFQGLGASGMIMGALGLLSAQTLRRPKHPHLPFKHRVVGLAAGVMLFILYGLAPGTDIAAHIGGFFSGVVFGAILMHSPARHVQKRSIDFIGALILTMLVVLAWGLALGGGK